MNPQNVGITPDTIFDPIQAAQYLGIDAGTLAVWRCTGRYALPFIKVGRKVRYRLSALNAWLESRTQANGAIA
jgi:excisionase family DNA binding protein